jgi:uncharacterized protein YjbI with pentapeptide repeats
MGIGHVSPKWRRLIIPGAWSLAAILFLAFVWGLPILELTAWKDSLEPKEYLDAVNARRTTYAQIAGGAGIAFGLYFAWRRIKISEDGQITDRFTGAVEHLGSGKLEMRLGGIYALERIARDSVRDHWQIMEILTTYVRENANWKKTSPGATNRADIQAILTVIGRRSRSFGRGEDQQLNLSGTDLRGYDFGEAHLQGAVFNFAHLDLANLHTTNLQRASFVGSWLDAASLLNADLGAASFKNAHLNNTIFDGANLADANFLRARLQGATFGATNLARSTFIGAQIQDVDFTGANLERANLFRLNLSGVDFSLANLRGAILRNADMSEAIGVTREQIELAHTNSHTKLPRGLESSGG